MGLSLDGFRRRTTSGRFIPEIDGFRFLAIALVVGYHLHLYALARWGRVGPAGLIHPVASVGRHGVEVFFSISGFILGLPFAAHHLAGRPRPNSRAYFARRVTRLEPPYVLAMVGFAIMLVVFNGEPVAYVLQHLGASLIYQHNLIYDDISTINAVAWTLEVEVQFYVLAPLLAAIFALPECPRRTLLVLGCAVVVAGRAVLFDGGRIDHALPNFIEYFMAGFLLADIYITRWSEAPRADSRRWDVIGVVASIGLLVAWHDRSATHLFGAALVLLALIAGFRGRLLNAVLRNRWIVVSGGMCYSIYLLHYPLISGVGPVVERLPHPSNYDLHLLLQAAIIVPITLIVSAVFFRLVERPCMAPNWPTHLRARIVKRRARGLQEPQGPLGPGA